MIELSPEVVTIIMLGGVLVGVLTGYPLGLVLGFVTLIVGFSVFGNTIVDLIYQRALGLLGSYVLLAVPLFVFMGLMLERSGITERLYDSLYLWLGGFRGGLAVITVLIGTIMAACVGIISASITMLAVVALPSMIRRGYNKSLAAGSICAGGCLGILIPPSIMLVIYGPMAGISVGKLFFGAFIPGLVLSVLYCVYIGIRSLIQPQIAPAVPIEERRGSFLKKSVVLGYSLVPPVVLIMSVLGVIFFGIAPPTEAAAVGAFIATLLAIVYRRFNMQVLKEVTHHTLRLCGMIFIMGAMAFAFVGVFVGAGCGDVVMEIILGTPGGRWGAFMIMMFVIFILGFFIEWIGIVFIMVPIITPIAVNMGFDPLWFAMMVCINFQTSFMTPPFAMGIFVLRGSADPTLGVTMADIIRGVIPFVIIIIIVLLLCALFPEIILWLPGQMLTR
jgi:tripartite ATP-independent transporter DctM subunit